VSPAIEVDILTIAAANVLFLFGLIVLVVVAWGFDGRR
jgi:hypothetical protein